MWASIGSRRGACIRVALNVELGAQTVGGSGMPECSQGGGRPPANRRVSVAQRVNQAGGITAHLHLPDVVRSEVIHGVSVLTGSVRSGEGGVRGDWPRLLSHSNMQSVNAHEYR
jgi:hypothetical protein